MGVEHLDIHMQKLTVVYILHFIPKLNQNVHMSKYKKENYNTSKIKQTRKSPKLWVRQRILKMTLNTCHFKNK